MTKLSTTLSRFHIPKWVAWLYGILAIGLVPWVLILSYTLPTKNVSGNWDMAWVGFDLAILFTVLLSTYFALRQSGWVSLTLVSVATLLFTDAWFDVLLSRRGRQELTALVTALLFELPLALVSLWISAKVSQQLIDSKD